MKYIFRNQRNKEIEIFEEDLLSAYQHLEKVVTNPGQYYPDLFAAFQERLEEIKKDADEYYETHQRETLDKIYLNCGRLGTIVNLYYREQNYEA